jgi:hypothetical protein
MAIGGKAAFVGGVVLGAIVAPIVMFSAGWIVTSGAEHANAERAADAAIVAKLTPICVHQFSQDTSRNADLAKLKTLDEYTRPNFVMKNGWATMPGSKDPIEVVANACAARLVALAK